MQEVSNYSKNDTFINFFIFILFMKDIKVSADTHGRLVLLKANLILSGNMRDAYSFDTLITYLLDEYDEVRK